MGIVCNMNDAAIELPESDRQTIIEKASYGWKPDEISLHLRQEEGSRITEESIEDYLSTGDARQEIDVRQRLRDKKADVAKEELVSDLRDVKDTLIDRAEELRENEMDDISNDTVSNLIDNIKLLGEFIGELQDKEDSASGIVNVNKLEQNFDVTNAVQYMPAEQKQGVVEQLQDDPDVENFVIQKQGE